MIPSSNSLQYTQPLYAILLAGKAVLILGGRIRLYCFDLSEREVRYGLNSLSNISGPEPLKPLGIMKGSGK